MGKLKGLTVVNQGSIDSKLRSSATAMSIVLCKLELLKMGLDKIEDESSGYAIESVTGITADINNILADFNQLIIM